MYLILDCVMSGKDGIFSAFPVFSLAKRPDTAFRRKTRFSTLS